MSFTALYALININPIEVHKEDESHSPNIWNDVTFNDVYFDIGRTCILWESK